MLLNNKLPFDTIEAKKVLRNKQHLVNLPRHQQVPNPAEAQRHNEIAHQQVLDPGTKLHCMKGCM